MLVIAGPNWMNFFEGTLEYLGAKKNFLIRKYFSSFLIIPRGKAGHFIASDIYFFKG